MMDDFRGNPLRTIWQGFRGIRIAGSRQSPMCWPEPWSMATVWVIAASLRAGDVQWMTAGSGILHQEMPKGDDQGRMHGFQLWANLPAHLKMVKPRYQDVPASEIPEVIDDDGTPCASSAASFGARPDPSKASPPNHAIST